MPSKRRQLNVRLSPESEARLEALVGRMRGTLGIPVSKADVIHAALVELEKRYPPGSGDLATAPAASPAVESPPTAPEIAPVKGKAAGKGRTPKGGSGGSGGR